MRPCQTILVLESLRKSSSGPLYRKGVMLSHDDGQTVRDVYLQWLLLLVDLGYLLPNELLRTGRRLWADMLAVDVLDLNGAFAECLQCVRMQDARGFKALCSKVSSHLNALLRKDMGLVLRGDVYAAKRLVQVFSYTGRLSLKDIDLTQQMLEDYMAIEENIPSTRPAPLVQRLNEIIRRWMKAFDPQLIHASHSQGASAFLGRTTLEIKYKNLTSDLLLRYAFGDPWWVTSPIPSTLDRMSQTMFVPKSFKTFRTISMESPTLMYFQQGVWGEIDRVVRHDRYLRAHMDFHDQSRNTSLAREGSLLRNYATIDLSSASDSVSFDLVKEIFRGTKLLRYVVATRSRQTLLPDGRIVSLRKFAPSGSALCFPVETLLFASICEIATRDLGFPARYSVYGDDIIVPTPCVERTKTILTNLGFRVNNTKTYSADTCWFRESCGGEFCDGYDVTPMRVSRKYGHRERDVRLEALVDLANAAYTKGFRNLRAFFLRKLRASGITPYFAPTSILSDNYTNYQAEQRWHKGLQVLQVKVTDLSDRYSPEALRSQNEELRYRHWLESTYDRKSVEFAYESVICRPTKATREVWREKPYELPDQELIDSFVQTGAKYAAPHVPRVEGLRRP